MGKASFYWLTQGTAISVFSPLHPWPPAGPLAGFSFPRLCSGTAGVCPALWCLQLPCFLSLWFSQIPAVGSSGRASNTIVKDRTNQESWTCRICKLKWSKTEQKSHQYWKWGKAVCQLIFPMLLSSKKRSCSEIQSSSACKARWSLDAWLPSVHI